MSHIPLLLADPSACLRWKVLKDLLEAPDDDTEMVELSGRRETDPIVLGILKFQRADGSWQPGSIGGGALANEVRTTGYALTRLGYLGLDRSHPAVSQGAEFLFSRQEADGSWALTDEDTLTDGSGEIPANERYTTIPLQTAFPLRGLAACGYAQDLRAERAYEWLLAQRLPDGAWPTGTAAGVYGGVGGYRRLPHSRWGCRTNTTAALICLAHHPERRNSEASKRALDLLLGRETREVESIGLETARMLGLPEPRGFLTYFARFDLAVVLDMCARVGASTDDERVQSLVEFIRGLRGAFGLWDSAAYPQAARWITYDLLRSLKEIGANTGWNSLEPRTPFSSYPKKPKRY